MKRLFHHFRVYPEPGISKRYYKVVILPTRAAMYETNRRFRKAWRLRRMANNFEALATWHEGGDKRRPNQIGHLLFYRASAKRGGIVVHELFHAALYYWCNQRRLPLNSIRTSKAREERFANILGRMTTQYWRAWYRLRLNRCA